MTSPYRAYLARSLSETPAKLPQPTIAIDTPTTKKESMFAMSAATVSTAPQPGPAPGAEATGGDRTAVPLQIAVVVGSIRTDRFCTAPASWITEQVRRREG